jgi:hypothetical protein
MSEGKTKRQQRLLEEYLKEKQIEKPEGLGFVDFFEKVDDADWRPLSIDQTMALTIKDFLTNRRIMGKIQVETRYFYFTTYEQDKKNLQIKYPNNPVICLSQVLGNWLSKLNDPLTSIDIFVLGTMGATLSGVKEGVDYEPFA